MISSVSGLGWHCGGQEDYNSWNFWKLPLPDIEDELKRFTQHLLIFLNSLNTFFIR
jgi:hypothetical protein